MKKFKDFEKLLNGRESRKIGNNTYIHKNGDSIAIRLHDTDIITATKKGIVYDSGGWLTGTTKQRMNEHGPVYITQRNGLWYFETDTGNIPYCDGATYNFRSGKVRGGSVSSVKKADTLKKNIKKYSKMFAEHLEKGDIDAPGPGDCWYCSMFQSGSNEHLLSHIKENYFVPSLLVNAMNEIPTSILHKDYVTLRLHNDPRSESLSGFNFQKDTEKVIAKYLKKHLSIAS